MLLIYGLKNCDTCQKAIRWVKAEKINFQFFDLRKDGITGIEIMKWVSIFGWQSMFNHRGTTWRKIGKNIEFEELNEFSATKFMVNYPALVKRPIFKISENFLIGFSEEQKIKIISLI